MKIHHICKYLGLLSGGFGGLLMLAGIIGFLSGEFLGVKYYYNFFLFAKYFIFFGIFGMVVYIACKDKDKKA